MDGSAGIATDIDGEDAGAGSGSGTATRLVVLGTSVTSGACTGDVYVHAVLLAANACSSAMALNAVAALTKSLAACTSVVDGWPGPAVLVAAPASLIAGTGCGTCVVDCCIMDTMPLEESCWELVALVDGARHVPGGTAHGVGAVGGFGVFATAINGE